MFQRQRQAISIATRRAILTNTKPKLTKKKSSVLIRELGTISQKHQQTNQTLKTSKIIPFTAAAVAASLIFKHGEFLDENGHEKPLHEKMKVMDSITRCDASSNMALRKNKAGPRRNVMLHRMRSVRARHLDEKYNVDFSNVLGEGAFGSVHPARLASTGQKVRT